MMDGKQGKESCRTLTGAWIETSRKARTGVLKRSRTLTGAWIETQSVRSEVGILFVAPSRVRGLKHFHFSI